MTKKDDNNVSALRVIVYGGSLPLRQSFQNMESLREKRFRC